jgi:hypothetical protein
VLRIVLFVAGAIVVLLFLGQLASWHYRRQAETAWATTPESLSAFAARYPSTPDSAAVVQLDELTRPLGIPMAIEPGHNSRTGISPRLGKETYAAGGFVTSQEQAGTDRIADAPPNVRAFLARERVRLDAIEAQIVAADDLQWAQDVETGWQASMPPLAGLRQLQNVLLARALLASREGRDADAARSLEASWRLLTSISRRPELISQLLAMALAPMQHGVIRCLRHPARVWTERLASQDFGAGVLRACQLEASGLHRAAASGVGLFDLYAMEEAGPRTGPTVLLGRLLTAPYVRLSLYDASARILQIRKRLQTEDPCRVDLVALGNEFSRSFPRWNILGRRVTPAFVRAWASVRDVSLDRDLTLAVLRGRTQPLSSPSAFCQGFTWVQSSEGRDTFKTTLEPPLPQPLMTAHPAWTFVASSRGARPE